MVWLYVLLAVFACLTALGFIWTYFSFCYMLRRIVELETGRKKMVLRGCLVQVQKDGHLEFFGGEVTVLAKDTFMVNCSSVAPRRVP